MSPRLRPALVAGGATLGTLLVVYGLSSFASWRRTQLAQPLPPTPAATPASLPTPAPPPESPLPLLLGSAEARRDTDQDGLPDNLEPIYQTDPRNKDTDGDGYLDGSEVANGYDPTIKSPKDKITIPTPTPSGPTYTEQYFDRVGLPPSRENLLKSAELDEFLAITNARGFLPAVRDEDLHVVSAAGKPAVAAYLDAVSASHNRNLTAVDAEDIETAFKALTTEKNAQPLDDLVAALARNAEVLRAAPVPREALALQKQYLAATLALTENAEGLKNYQGDFVGVLVAASRIDNLRGVFRAVSEGIAALERKYGIT